MKLYITDIRALPFEELWEKKEMLPKERQEQVERYKNSTDRARGFAAGLLLEYGLNRQGLTLREDSIDRQRPMLREDGTCYRKVCLERHAGGKPYLIGGENIYFNLSHSGDYAVAVFSAEEAGVDIEQKKRADRGIKLAGRFFMPQEYELLKRCTDEEEGRIFTKFWTRKESYLKAVGTGLRIPMDTFSVLEDRIGGYYVKSWEIPEEYAISVCAKEEILCEPEYIDLAELIREI